MVSAIIENDVYAPLPFTNAARSGSAILLRTIIVTAAATMAKMARVPNAMPSQGNILIYQYSVSGYREGIMSEKLNGRSIDFDT